MRRAPERNHLRRRIAPSHMNRILPILFFSALLASVSSARNAKPNIVFIFTDDQAPDTVAAWNTWGNDASVIKTPNMDRLVHSGTSFQLTYNMGAWQGAVCVSSRASLNTGRFLWHAQAAENAKYREQLDGGLFWSQRMKSAGYETYMTGKWHVTAPTDRIFDHVIHERPGMPSTVKTAYQRPVEGQPDAWHPWDKENGGYWKGGRHWSEVLADDAETFIHEAAGKQKPFFMYLAFNAPHDPRQAPESYVDMYPRDTVKVPENFQPLYPHHQAMALGSASAKALRDEALAPFPRTEFAIKTHRQEYYALVTHTDAQIGRILAALDKAGVAENTYIIFTADHGLAVGRHGLIGKQNMFEHSLRVPFVIVGPDIPKDRSIATRIYLQDAMATTLELAGADAREVEFRSVLPLIRGERKIQYDAIYGAYMKNQRAVIEGDHKLILYPTARISLLFDLSNDPLEMHDLSNKPGSQAVKQRLFSRLRKLQVETGDTLDLTKAYPGLAS